MQSFLAGEGTVYIILRIAVILLLTFAAAKITKAFSRRVVKSDRIHKRFLHSIVVVLIYLTGFVVALNEIPNFDNAFNTLLAGSGIAALTIGLAAQESLGNAINGMFISMFHPFEVGDRVRLVGGNITGYIEDITLRHTVIRTFINSRIIVPNSVINKEMIENSNYWDGKASSFVDVTITYGSDLELAQRIMFDIVTSHPDFVDPRPPENREGPPAKVYVRGLSLYGVELRVSMWTADVGKNYDACSDARQRIKLEFDRRGIQFARGPFVEGNL